jgi:hypothetical protein
MSKYEFTFVVTDVELSEDQRLGVGRAVALAGTAALGAQCPAEAVTAPLVLDEFIIRHWCGMPRLEVAVPRDVVAEHEQSDALPDADADPVNVDTVSET